MIAMPASVADSCAEVDIPAPKLYGSSSVHRILRSRWLKVRRDTSALQLLFGKSARRQGDYDFRSQQSIRGLPWRPQS